MKFFSTDFSQIIGHENVKKQLMTMIKKQKIGHSLLFSGSQGIGKELMAWAFISAMIKLHPNHLEQLKKIENGQHPDVHVYRPEGKLGFHSIQSMRQLSEEVHFPPYEAHCKFFLIYEADRMLTYSANALLKTFEEPPPNTLIILISHASSQILPTITSRCRTIYFAPLSQNTIASFLKSRGITEEKCNAIAGYAQGSISKAIELCNESDEIRLNLLKFLAHSHFNDFRSVQNALQFFNERYENLKKCFEKETKENWSKNFTETLTAHQQQSMEKEIEGLTSLKLNEFAQQLFEITLSWYRDCQIFLLGGSKHHLINQDFANEILQAVQSGNVLDFKTVYQFISDAELSLQRSTAFSICLENLFLKLNRS